MKDKDKIGITILLGFYSIVLTLGMIFFKGTGDMGDSIVHYLFALHAPAHPELYFDHWAKPVFVLLASPFAQFGFVGLKIFNSIITLATIYTTYRIALKLKLENAWICALIMAFMPLYYILTLSALTEPLFALFTAVSLYWCVNKKYIAACVLLSFLPYVRSEGLIVIGVFALYFLYTRRWAILPYLITGSILYAIAGYSVHQKLLWVFTAIPYAKLSSAYGHGGLLHFVEQLINVTGIPIYALFWLGLGVGFRAAYLKKLPSETLILVYFGFICYFVAHTLFWYLGIFNSMGLKRVLLGVAPLIALITLIGYNFIIALFHNSVKVRTVIAVLIIGYIVVFPFTPNPSAIQWKKDLMINQEQTQAEDVANKTSMFRQAHQPIMYNNHYLGLVLKNDRFSLAERIPLTKENLNNLQSGTLIIWDNKLVGAETDVLKSELDTDNRLNAVYTCSATEFGQSIIYAAYQKK